MGKKIEWIWYNNNRYVRFRSTLYKIMFLSKSTFSSRMKTWFGKIFYRGYMSGGIIYIKDGTWLGLDRLVIHEIGHILGYDHTWYPFIMHPSWIGRWFWKWNKDDDI